MLFRSEKYTISIRPAEPADLNEITITPVPQPDAASEPAVEASAAVVDPKETQKQVQAEKMAQRQAIQAQRQAERQAKKAAQLAMRQARQEENRLKREQQVLAKVEAAKEDAESYSEQLEQLHVMGFANDRLNLRMLIKHKGDLTETVNNINTIMENRRQKRLTQKGALSC